MARKRKPLPVLEGVTITDVAAEGKALARVNDMVVFVPYVAPGDIVDIQLTRKSTAMPKGKLLRFTNMRRNVLYLSANISVSAADANGSICPTKRNYATNRNKSSTT